MKVLHASSDQAQRNPQGPPAMNSKFSWAIWIIALAIFAVLIAAGFYSLAR